MIKNQSELLPKLMLIVLTVSTLFIGLFLIYYIFHMASPVLMKHGIINFVTGSEWSYPNRIYGIRDFIISTIIMTIVSLILAVPVSIFTAIFLAEYAPTKVVFFLRPFIELLVGIPSVVYGILGLYVLGGFFADYLQPFLSTTLSFIFFFKDLNQGSGNGLLLASTILAIMILPTIISISEDALRSVSRDHREASYSLGATQWETIRHVVIPTAFGGIVSAVVLGMMRAMGETMAIVMLLGNSQHIPGSLFDTGYAMTSKLVNEIGHYAAMDEPRSALFGIAAVLFALEIIFVGVARKLGGKL